MCSMNGSLRGNYFIWDNFIFLSKGIHMEINSGKTKAVHLNMYKLLGAKSGAFLEWDGSFDERLNEIFVRFSLFLSTTWLQSKKNWFVQPKSRYSMKKQHAVMDFWINQHQVIFLAYRMYNPTVQSLRSLLKNIWSGQWMNFWILPITHQPEKFSKNIWSGQWMNFWILPITHQLEKGQS